MPVILFLLGAVLLLVFVSGAYVFAVACIRRKDLPWLEEEEIKKTSYGKYYHYILESNKWLTEHNARDIYVTSHDKLRLHGLWIPAENPKGTIILAHGYRSTMLVDFSLAFDFYHKAGMNLLVPEQRAHGKSEGRYITFGVKESKDILAWIDYHNNRFGSCPMILSGLSMGASTVMYLADQKLPDNVKGIVADCGFTSPKAILTSIFKRVTHLPAAPSLVVTDILARLFAGFSISQKDTREILRNNRYPIFMVHGTSDDFVPCWMTEQGYAACVGNKRILLVEGADHGLSFVIAKDKYTSMIKEFLKENVEGIA